MFPLPRAAHIVAPDLMFDRFAAGDVGCVSNSFTETIGAAWLPLP
jgi:hypothetical protein